MKESRKYIFYALSVLFFLLAVTLEYSRILLNPEATIIQDFRETLLGQEAKLSKYLDQAEIKLSGKLPLDKFSTTLSDLYPLFENEGLGFLVFSNQKLVYWSNNQFAVQNLPARISNQNRLLRLPNGIYVWQKRMAGQFELYGLIHLKNSYSYQNQYLENTFVSPFKLPSGYTITAELNKDSHEISDQKMQYLFSVLPSKNTPFTRLQLYMPAFLYLLCFLFVLMSIFQIAEKIRIKHFVLKMLSVPVMLLLIYWVHIAFGMPAILRNFQMFGPQSYAGSPWLPSLGDFFLIALLFFFWSLVFVRQYRVKVQSKKRLIVPAFIFTALLYQLVAFMIANLIRNSNINYQLNRITEIDQYSVCAYLSIALLLFSVFLIHIKLAKEAESHHSKGYFTINLGFLAGCIALILLFPSGWAYMLTLFFAVNVLQCQIGKMHLSANSLAYSILFISLFSAATLLLVYDTITKRDIQVQKLKAITLGSEQDPVAVVLLSRMQGQLAADSIIPTLLTPPYNDLINYLTRNYFSGYFRKYDIQFVPCAGTDSVLIQSENVSEPCFPYFEKMIDQYGIRIQGTDFYFMNHMNGRVSYFGKLHYPLATAKNGISVFVEIDSKTISEGIGFPELLKDRSLIKPLRYKHLSYAKYFEDELVNRSGDYTYNYNLQSYNLTKSGPEFQILQWDGYNHLIYRFNEKNCIIVSNRTLTFADYLISFPYFFVFYFLLALVVSFGGNSSFRTLIIPQDLRFRIQVSIISIVLVSLLFVAAGTIYYNIKAYRNRHEVDLQDKIKSISEEIKSLLSYVNTINPDMQQRLNNELYKLSNIFRTDINIYGTNGELIATSRPEIFARGITTERMNSTAYYELSDRFQLNYFQPEKIGTLSYLSAYEPIINFKGDYLGYLNLPYFTREDELKQNISTFIVAFINLYLILFLASVIVAVLLSNRITQPLTLIREKLRGIQLGKENEQINYEAEDEIGALVKEYNHKVDELAESADMLARSERESAWREMAKQIAHEIKNPLTPMKLNIQYLQRAKTENNSNYDDYFDRVTKSLIEQIDALSGIASEFSDFAQIPKAKNEVFNLIEVLQNMCSLFEPNPNLDIKFEKNRLTEVNVFADREQLSRAFLNLIKNGIQSIPPDRKGEIKLSVKKLGTTALVVISDNGTGISDEAQAHLFEPNFTTKTSGMGLGLSIVRSILNNFGGKISYETADTIGTSFVVEIPLQEAKTNG